MVISRLRVQSRVFAAAAVFGAGAVVGSAQSGPADGAEGVEFFETHVRPVLVDHCYGCHSAGAKTVRGELLLDSRAGWEKGGSSGKPAVVPGDPDASPLIQAVRHTDPNLAMPPKEKLADAQIAALEDWVRMGAPDPRTGGARLEDPFAKAKDHWAFQPVREPALPSVREPAWVRNGIDRFILASLEAQGLAPAPRADKRTLIRRASQVLTGLPPTAQEVAEFEADTTPEAFDRVVERLLASPRYGERWGRHWLDVARYADTKGYVFEEERRYPYAYTYRDYVIRAFNEDKPYDRFLMEQIAADQLVEGDDRSALAALGFLTLGRRFLNNPHDIIDDRIDVLTRGTMALTVTCARCHDHKYDPIPIADYYSLYGVFASSEEPGEKPLLGTLPDPVGYEVFKKELDRREKERDDFVREKEEAHRRKLRETVGDYLLAAQDSAAADDSKREELARSRQLSPVVVQRWVDALNRWRGEGHPLFHAWFDFAGIAAEGFADAARPVAAAVAANAGARHDAAVAEAFAGDPPATLREVADRYNKIFSAGGGDAVGRFLSAEGTPIALEPAEIHRLFDVPEAQRKRALQRAVEELQATHPGAPPRAMALVDKAKPADPVVFKRGNPRNRGDTVPRQFLELLAGPHRKPFSRGSGRLELAEAIASPDNPLTARVAVNRVWLQHFGAGLVRTPADFGLRSDAPTHRELLDWLAATFVKEGWSMKALHRLILGSATWQQRSEASPEARLRDPDNRFLSHQNRRRLDFEATRDMLLAASRALDLSMGGHAVEITTRDYARRRTVYGFVERQNLPGVFRTFDFASPDTTSAQRFQTTVPQQALFFLNSPFALDQARGLAGRPDVAGLDDADDRITAMYRIVFQRDPEPEEVHLARQYLAKAGPEAEPVPAPAPVWQYGFGTIDPKEEAVLGFRALPHFTGKAWQGGPKLPDPELGWLMLNAEGGHPGGRDHGAVIRRWTSPADAVVEVTGRLRHAAESGDGVRATLVSSRHGILGEWKARHGATPTRIAGVRVQRGEILDFVVDCLETEDSDSFQWAPKVRVESGGTGGSSALVWDAREEFGPLAEAPPPLKPWERLAQVLLMANEAVFVD